MQTYTDFSQPLTRNGVTYVPRVCAKCGGSGYLPGYEHIDNARCWACLGLKGAVKWETLEDAEKREATNERRRARAAEKRAAAIEAERQEQATAFQVWLVQHPILAKKLPAYEGRNDFIRDMAETIRAGRPLTDKQAAAVHTALEREEQEQAAAEKVPAGRQLVTGRVLSTKAVDSMYGSTLKMLVDCGAFRVWGTVPATLDAHAGDTVSFTATLEPSNDKGFGFFKRPAKAKVLEGE